MVHLAYKLYKAALETIVIAQLYVYIVAPGDVVAIAA